MTESLMDPGQPVAIGAHCLRSANDLLRLTLAGRGPGGSERSRVPRWIAALDGMGSPWEPSLARNPTTLTSTRTRTRNQIGWI